jgi:hypothetical protein
MMKLTEQSAITFIRHCEECSGRIRLIDLVKGILQVKERRSNLPSPIKLQEPFSIFKKITSLQTQSKEIAARIQQSQLRLFFSQYIRRLAMTSVLQEARFL